MCRPRFVVLMVLAAALALPGVASADHQRLSINYFSHANTEGAPDAKVRITHNGNTFQDLCAMIYVFRPDQQLAACCGCKITPNGLLTLSVNKDLAGNPLTAEPLPTGVIKIVETEFTLTAGPPGSSKECNPAQPNLPLPEDSSLRAWATHIQDAGGWFAITEADFIDGAANVSTGELGRLQLKCEAITGGLIQGEPGLGSGYGLCHCPSENGDAVDPWKTAAAPDPPLTPSLESLLALPPR